MLKLKVYGCGIGYSVVDSGAGLAYECQLTASIEYWGNWVSAWQVGAAHHHR